MFWLAGKRIVSPQTLQTHINTELEKSRLYSSIYTMEYIKKTTFYSVKLTSGSYFGLKFTNHTNIFCVQNLSLRSERTRNTKSNMMF